ncbi:hypothetical protein DV113_004732 [Geotrichum candidum]|nr:hypothetical protein DV113_004732 [Geotrichum candidum]KAI8132235.1 hypothetical protein DUD61_004114 [Geotrichum candidum]KAI9211488.1 hypothetical protein DS838_003633 [Geotrichum bryndzae]
MVEYKSFLDMPAPAGYVPGLGRGATGFTTRSDIGPARAGIAGDALKAAAASKKSEGENGNEEEEEDEDRFKDPENDTGLFSVPGIFDPEDEEADAIYNEIDKRMEERRKTQREAREHEMEEEYKKKNPKISDQFSDLKRDLGTVSAEQWANLPEKRVLQKALEVNPHSDTLWRAAVNLETDSEDAKLMLTQAVELVPMSEDLWLALAHLETPANSRKVLNKARKALKTSRAVWIAAARLEEQDGGSQDKVYKRMERGVKELEAEGGLPDRAQWIAEAEKCEAEGAPLTCHAIIKATLGQGIEEEDRKSIWMEDGKDCIRRGSYETARAIYAYALQVFPESKSLWLATCQLEKLHGKKEALWEILEKAVKTSPHTEAFWLMYAKEKSIAGDILGAQEVLSRAFELNPNSEDIWLSAVSMEAESKNYDRARKLLERARQEADTERVWIKSVSLERQLANYDVALSLATEGLEKYPQNPKLWMQKGQIYESLKEFHKAGQTYFAGTKACPFSVPLWLLLARFEQSQGVAIRARSTLDKASIVNPKNELIWLERIRLELREGNTSQTSTLISRALQECPNSGLIWSERILLEPRLQRKNKILEGVKACENDAFILITVGRDFWQNGKFGKAKTWFERAIKRDPDNGDGWIWFYKFLSEKGRPEDVQTLVDGFKAADPHHGLVWPEYLKDPSNFGKDLSEILKLAAASVQL